MQPKRPELIDLTSSTENCAICSNVLKQGEESAARAFVFKDCGCVCTHPRQIPCQFIDLSVQVVCGECFLGNILEEEREVKPITKQL